MMPKAIGLGHRRPPVAAPDYHVKKPRSDKAALPAQK
jgi:hypothetical protein